MPLLDTNRRDEAEEIIAQGYSCYSSKDRLNGRALPQVAASLQPSPAPSQLRGIHAVARLTSVLMGRWGSLSPEARCGA
jgi:hypothetical protein